MNTTELKIIETMENNSLANQYRILYEDIQNLEQNMSHGFEDEEAELRYKERKLAELAEKLGDDTPDVEAEIAQRKAEAQAKAAAILTENERLLAEMETFPVRVESKWVFPDGRNEIIEQVVRGRLVKYRVLDGVRFFESSEFNASGSTYIFQTNQDAAKVFESVANPNLLRQFGTDEFDVLGEDKPTFEKTWAWLKRIDDEIAALTLKPQKQQQQQLQVVAPKLPVVYDKSAIMKRSWELRRMGMTASNAMKQAWAEYKNGGKF